MNDAINPLATHNLPSFVAGPGQADPLLFGIGIFLIVVVFLLGVAFLWLHSLPERVAHNGQKLQFELVAVLCMLALFTHNNLLWGIALVLAMIDIPDLTTPLRRISDALERMTRMGRDPVAAATAAGPAGANDAASDAPPPQAAAETAAEAVPPTNMKAEH